MNRTVIPFGAAAAVLLAVLISLPSDGLFSADSGAKYWQTLAFAEGEGRPRTFEYPAATLDPRLKYLPPFTAGVNGRLASIYPVLFPLLAAAPVAAFGDQALRAVPWLAALAAAWVAGLMTSALRGRNVTGAAAAAVLAATPLAFYSVTFWEHSLAALLVAVGLLLVVGDRPGEQGWRWRWGLFGVLIGAGAWVRTEIGFLAPVLLLAVVVVPPRRRAGSLASGVAGAISGAVLGGWVQFLALGRWQPLHVTYHLESSFHADPFVTSRLESLLRFLAPHWSAGLATLVWLLALAVVLTRGGSRSRLGLALATAAVGCSALAAIVVPLVRWLHGTRPTEAFPFAAPAAAWLVLGAFPLVLWGQDRAVVFDRRRLVPLVAALWLPVAVFLARAVRSFEWGGRLFLPTVVTLAAVMFSFPIAAGSLRAVRRSIFFATVAAAVFIQGFGLVLVRHGTATHEEIAAEVSAFIDPSEPVVTDAYMVPLVAGRGWFEARYLYCTTQPNLSQIVARIGTDGATRWTYATVLRAPGSRLEIDDLLVDAAGRRWLLTDRLERPVRTQAIRLLRFRRVAAARSTGGRSRPSQPKSRDQRG